jgi:hypothetical protein
VCAELSVRREEPVDVPSAVDAGRVQQPAAHRAARPAPARQPRRAQHQREQG